jgi:hypothetical protein
MKRLRAPTMINELFDSWAVNWPKTGLRDALSMKRTLNDRT